MSWEGRDDWQLLGQGEDLAAGLGELTPGAHAGDLAAPQDLIGEGRHRGIPCRLRGDLLPSQARKLGIPGEVRPASQYLTGRTRDFVTVLAPPNPG